MPHTLPKNTEKVNTKTSKKLFYFLLCLVLLRPSLDIIGQKEFYLYHNLPSFNFNAIIGCVVFITALFFILKNLKSIRSTPLFYPIFIFLGLIFLSIFFSLDYTSSIREFIRLSSIFFLYFLAYKLIESQKDWLLLLKIILISYIVPGAFAFIQLIGGFGLPDDFGGFNRIYGTFTHPNLFAFYTFFILGLILTLILTKNSLLPRRSGLNSESSPFLSFPAISRKHRSNVICLQIAAIILTLLLLATYTRSALACLMIFILIFGIFKYRKLLLGSLMFFALLYLFSDIFQQRIWELISLDPYGSVIWRFRLWRDIIPVSLWQPWLGYGSGTFNQLVEYYRGFKWGSLEAHNDYLKIFVENGILGLATYLWLIVVLLFSLSKKFIKSIGKEKIMALGIFTICLSLFIASFFDNILRTTALQWNLWILLGAWLRQEIRKH
ncbi:MAG: O-antigen ligase family protein [Patescibacteria group bacterium]|nr:O-antigen ligase family protein [Patescibacteria group bacterium]